MRKRIYIYYFIHIMLIYGSQIISNIAVILDSDGLEQSLLFKMLNTHIK